MLSVICRTQALVLYCLSSTACLELPVSFRSCRGVQEAAMSAATRAALGQAPKSLAPPVGEPGLGMPASGCGSAAALAGPPQEDRCPAGPAGWVSSLGQQGG